MADKLVKLDIYGGLLGVGKTTLIKQMLKTAYRGYKVAIIENEIGKVNLDEEALAEPSIEVKPLTSGCICCTVKGVFTGAVELLIAQEHPDYIIIEPTGVADFATVADACTAVEAVELNRAILIVNGRKLLTLFKVVGEFLYEQIRTAGTVFLNFSEQMTEEKLEETKAKLWEVNPDIHIIAVPLEEVDGDVIPDGLADYHGKTEEKKHPVSYQTDLTALAVEEKTSTEKRTKMRAVRTKSKETDSWSYTFTKPFTPAMKARLDELFLAEENLELWRGKGYLTMADGGILKVDYTYGDAFAETVPSFNPEKMNILVMIGRGSMKKKSLQWCKEIEAM